MSKPGLCNRSFQGFALLQLLLFLLMGCQKLDADRDGYSTDDGDCDDRDQRAYPGAQELCDGVDNNCDERTDEGLSLLWYLDSDHDSYGEPSTELRSCLQPAGYVTRANDCDDARADVYPSAPEICDQVDNDCDGSIDEGFQTLWYPDADGDSYGAILKPSDEIRMSCTALAGYVHTTGDCDDTDPALHPGAQEVCDGIDNDCDTVKDDGLAELVYYPDEDLDGYGDSSSETSSCAALTGFTLQGGDCDDTDPEIFPDALERCDHIDNNCDGLIDEGIEVKTWFRDQDDDGYGDTDESIDDCLQPAGYIAARGDCNDLNDLLYPGAADVSGDGIDQDCGGTTGLDPHVGLNAMSQQSISKALKAAVAGQTIWVGPGARGAYNENSLSFEGKAIKLMATHPDGRTAIHGSNRGVVFVFERGEKASSELNGFSITGGLSVDGDGGGIRITEASPTIATCTFSENNALRGGAISLYRSSATLTDVTFESNAATDGGAVYLKESTPLLDTVSFHMNRASQDGGALYLEDSNPTFLHGDCTANEAQRDGGGMFLLRSKPSITAFRLTGNLATLDGGGLQLESSDPTLTNVILEENLSNQGGAIAVQDSSPVLDHCTLADNSAHRYGGGMLFFKPLKAPKITSSILAYNGSGNIYLEDPSSYLNITYSALYNPTEHANHNLSSLSSTNLTDDPQFISVSSSASSVRNDLHLRPTSSVVDAAPGSSDPDGSKADMGAYGGALADFDYYEDADGDGMYDGWEIAHGLSVERNDATEDPDYDRLRNGDEFQYFTDPHQADSDRDAFDDRTEVLEESNPLDWYSQPGQQGPVTAVVPGDFSTIQAALDAIVEEGDIVVAPGTYSENLRMQLKRVILTSSYGSAYTRLTGDATLAETEDDDSGAVVTIATSDRDSILSAQSVQLTLSGFTFSDGQALEGGGIRLSYVTGDLSDIVLKDNIADRRGGGAFIFWSDVTLTDFVVSGNQADEDGGGLYLYASAPELARGVIEGNQAEFLGGGAYLSSSSPLLRHLDVRDNIAEDRGGAFFLSYSSPEIINSSVTHNTAAYGGGAFFLSDSSPQLTQVTVAGNGAGTGGGLYLHSASSPTLVNSILAFNATSNLHNNPADPGEPSILYSDVYNPEGYASHNLDGLSDTCLEVDPRFMNGSLKSLPTYGDFHLLPDSPAIDQGDPHIMDPDGSRSDMGRYGGTDGDFSYYDDSDQDGMYDGWEMACGYTPENLLPTDDLDEDGLTNAEEFLQLSDPLDSDSDGDNFTDGYEVSQSSSPSDWYARPNSEGWVASTVPGDFATIQEAIDAIGSEGAVDVLPGTYQERIRVELKRVALRGVEGASLTFLEGVDDSVVVVRSAELSMSGFTITNGHAIYGAGLFLSSVDGTLADLVIQQNTASFQGGGLFLFDSNPVIENSEIAHNRAQDGGGIFMSGSLCSLIDSELVSNAAERGGGLYLDDSAPTIEATEVVANEATDGGGLYLFNSTPRINETNIEDNDAAAYGGGLYASFSSPQVSGSFIWSNGAGLEGGGLYLTDSNPKLLETVIASNLLTGDDAKGAGMSLHNASPRLLSCTLLENAISGAYGQGGAIYAEESAPLLIDSEIYENGVSGLEGRGGGLYLTGSNPELENCVIYDNDAQEGGGGFYLEASSPRLTDCRISHNHAYGVTGGGGAYVEDSSPTFDYCTLFGNVSAGNGGALRLVTSSPLITECTVSENSAEGDGGGISLEASNASLVQSTISDNQTTDDRSRGGGLYMTASSPDLIGTTLLSNEAKYQGGGIFMTASSPTLEDCEVVDNLASSIEGGGGGIYVDSSTPSMLRTDVWDNRSEAGGGGLFVVSSSLSFTEVEVVGNLNNSNSVGGGGLHLLSSSATLNDVLIAENSSNASGGGLFLSSSSPNISRSVILNNQAYGQGGGFYLHISNIVLKNSTVQGNAATLQGGGLYLYQSSPQLINETITLNSGYTGGGLYIGQKSNPTLSNCTLAGNSGGYGGGIFMANDSKPVITNTIIAFNAALNVYNDPDSPAYPTITYSDLYNPLGAYSSNLASLDRTNLIVDPRFVNYTPGGEAETNDFHLRPTSPVIDMGAPSTYDSDGSRADLGSYGGSGADRDYYEDQDRDGLFDGWELANGLDPTTYDANEDADGDGVSNSDEFNFGCNPLSSDTDGDGFEDGLEIKGSDPTDWFIRPGSAGVAEARVPGDFPTIQSAINAIAVDGKVVVEPGTWRENLRIELKRVQLFSSSGLPEDTFLSPTSGTVVTALSADLKMSGFTVTHGSSTYGGGLFLNDTAGELTHLTVTGNKASVQGGGLFLIESDPTISVLTVTSNTADQGAGMYLSSSHPAMSSCTFSENDATHEGGGLYLEDSSPGISKSRVIDNTGSSGAGLFAVGFQSNLEELEVSGNLASDLGGGVYITASEPEISECVFSSNEADMGGGLYVSDSTLSISFTEFSGNIADTGAGLYFYESESELVHVDILDNRAEHSGGGAFIESSDATFDYCSIGENQANIDGGGLYFRGQTPDLNNVLIADNNAEGNGGGIMLNGSSPSLIAVSVRRNRANHGAGVYMVQSSPLIRSCSFLENVAKYDGGGMYIDYSSPNIISTNVLNNLSDQYGAGIYVALGSSGTKVQNSIVAYNSFLNIYNVPSNLTPPSVRYSDAYCPGENCNHNLNAPDPTLLTVEPAFLAYDSSGRPIDEHLAVGSPLIAAGDPSMVDPDFSRSDIGVFSGSLAGSIDLDGDGLPNYFWPGDLEANKPYGINTANYDCDDEDPLVTSCGG